VYSFLCAFVQFLIKAYAIIVTSDRLLSASVCFTVKLCVRVLDFCNNGLIFTRLGFKMSGYTDNDVCICV
jgi:hypothetical protein